MSGKTTTEHIATFKSGKGEEHQNNFWAWYDIEPLIHFFNESFDNDDDDDQIATTVCPS